MKKKRKKQKKPARRGAAAPRPRPLTLAQEIDHAIAGYYEAERHLDAAETARERAKAEVVRLAAHHGIPDGKSWQLTGRKRRCSVTEGLHLAVSMAAVTKAKAPKRWLVQLVRHPNSYEVTKAARKLIENARLRKGLPKTVLAFLRSVKKTHDYTVHVKEGKA